MSCFSLAFSSSLSTSLHLPLPPLAQSALCQGHKASCSSPGLIFATFWHASVKRLRRAVTRASWRLFWIKSPCLGLSLFPLQESHWPPLPVLSFACLGLEAGAERGFCRDAHWRSRSTCRWSKREKVPELGAAGGGV